MSYRVLTMRHGEHAWSIRIVISGESMDLYRSPDSWLTSHAEVEHERKRIERMLKKLEKSNA